MSKQPLRQDAGQWRYVHLNQIRKIRGKNAGQSVAKLWMIPADAEYAPAAQQIEVADPRAVKQILAGSAAEAHIVADGLQHAHHHFVHVARVQCIALRFPLRKHRHDIETRFHGVPWQIPVQATGHRSPLHRVRGAIQRTPGHVPATRRAAYVGASRISNGSSPTIPGSISSRPRPISRNTRSTSTSGDIFGCRTERVAGVSTSGGITSTTRMPTPRNCRRSAMVKEWSPALVAE